MLGHWRMFDVQESIDGAPLVTQVRELVNFVNYFPYDRLPPVVIANSHSVEGGSATASALVSSLLARILRWCLRPEAVYAMVILYLVSETPVVWLRNVMRLDDDTALKNPRPRQYLQWFVAVHNLLLFVFSAIVAVGSWTSVLGHYSKYGSFFDTYCDPHKTLWNQHNLGYWSTWFYLSKYYEWVDTWILVLKKGTGGASFLQYYHHAGIVLAMYGGVASQSSWLSWVVLLNSVIHTFMYLYFFVKTLRPSLRIAAAQYLTQAQMLQFVTGIVGTLGVLWMGDQCDTASSRFALSFLQVYGLGLLALFAAFHRRKYRSSSSSKSNDSNSSKTRQGGISRSNGKTKAQ